MATAAKGAIQTRSVNPCRRGERRIHWPYLSTKYWMTCAGVSPAARRSRTMPRIWLAISDGESATDRFWHTTQRSWAATSYTSRSFTCSGGLLGHGRRRSEGEGEDQGESAHR